MKHFLLLFVIVFFIKISNAQNFEQIAEYKFKKVEDYKTEKNKVLQCANYLFENPANQNELNRLTAIQYIIKWMEGTPDYTFKIGEKATSLTKGNNDLLALYFVGMTKVVLDEKEEKKLSNEEIYNRTEKLLVKYCSNPDNKMKPSRKIKKIMKGKS